MNTSSRRGFTLIELLVVIAVIGVLIGLLMPAVQAAREAARRVQCVNNLKQVGLALHSYEATNSTYVGGNSKWSATARLLPYMEQGSIANSMNFSTGYQDPMNQTARQARVNTFLCPSAPNNSLVNDEWPHGGATSSVLFQGAPTDYRFFAGWRDSVPQPGDPITPDMKSGLVSAGGAVFRAQAEITDGLANTLAASECVDSPNKNAKGGVVRIDSAKNNPGALWADPDSVLNSYSWTSDGSKSPGPGVVNASNFRGSVRSLHPAGANALFLDGSVHFLKDSIDKSVFYKLVTVNGGECISSDAF